MPATEQQVIETQALHLAQKAGREMMELVIFCDEYPRIMGQAIKGHSALMDKCTHTAKEIVALIQRQQQQLNTVVSPNDSGKEPEETATFCKKCGSSLALHRMELTCPEN